MSNKRKKDRNKIASLDLSAAGDTNPSAIVSREIQPLESQLSKSGLLARLKAHWLIFGVIAFLALGALGAGLKYLEEDAHRQMLNGKLNTGSGNNQSLLNSVNPFLPAALPNPTPQLSKEFIYAGDRLLTVEDANATAVPPSDLAVWRPNGGGWYVMGSSGVMRAAVGFGQNGDTPAAGDYDGDGKTDFCVVRPDAAANEAKWFILKSGDGVIAELPWGQDEDWDKPVQADYDGDGKTDRAVIHTTQNSNQFTWVLSRSSNQSAVDNVPFGDKTTDTPEPADYDGDGKADVAVWRNSTKSFLVLRSSDGQFQSVSFADTNIFHLQEASQEPVAGDYDGDGRADFAVRDGVNWVILKSSNGAVQITNWGVATDKAVQNDYDGDGKVDIAVWRAQAAGSGAVGDWYILNSSGSPTAYIIEQWGQADDYPVPVFYRR